MASINPHWHVGAVWSLFYDHLAMTKNEALYRLAKKYPEDIAEFDRIEKQVLTMADALSDGIVKQFPERFR